MTPEKGTIYILSDGTGETAATMVKAALVQFAHKNLQIVRRKNVRTEAQLTPLVEEVFQRQGLIAYTIVSESLRQKIKELTADKGIPSIDLLGPLLQSLDMYFGNEGHESKVGALRAVDDRYFRRIEAIEYTVNHDDGKTLADIDQADIVLVGISRSSKTPLSIFLGHKGWKVANVPIVLNSPLPEELFKVDQRKVVGLIIEIDNLHRIRRKRLEKFGQDPGGEYASQSHILNEIEYARDIYKRNKKWPVFDVTDRALEETASEIIKLVATRMDIPFDNLL